MRNGPMKMKMSSLILVHHGLRWEEDDAIVEPDCYYLVNMDRRIDEHQLIIDFKKAYDSVKREVLYTFLKLYPVFRRGGDFY